MSKKSKEKFGKIIYFDEQAAVDFLELEKEGSESIIIKKLNETAAQVQGEVALSKGFFSIAKLKLSGNASHQKNNIFETQITSTLISSFMDAVEANDNIVRIDYPQLIISKESFAYYRNLVPIMHMIDDINKLQTIDQEAKENFDGINIKAIESTLDSLSGYYDFLCICDDNERKIVRFNIAGLRNNYNLNDLTKMHLKLFGVKVGVSLDTNLEFKHQIDKMLSGTNVNSSGLDFDEEESKELTYDIIDVILAGI